MSAPRRARAALAAALAGLLAACTSLPPLPAASGEDSYSGRLAVRIDGSGSDGPRAFSAAFDLRGGPARGALGLSTPLGSMLAQARWSPAEVSLTTPQGTRRYAGLGELTREALGESVPVEAWFDWLRGRPWPGAASEATKDPATPSVVSTAVAEAPDAAASAAAPTGRFIQLGWIVDASQAGQGFVTATRREPLPVVTVRIKLDPA